jgi:hypothetical protein
VRLSEGNAAASRCFSFGATALTAALDGMRQFATIDDDERIALAHEYSSTTTTNNKQQQKCPRSLQLSVDHLRRFQGANDSITNRDCLFR